MVICVVRFVTFNCSSILGYIKTSNNGNCKHYIDHYSLSTTHWSLVVCSDTVVCLIITTMLIIYYDFVILILLDFTNMHAFITIIIFILLLCYLLLYVNGLNAMYYIIISNIDSLCGQPFLVYIIIAYSMSITPEVLTWVAPLPTCGMSHIIHNTD